MATLTEVADLDSGVASPESAPEGQFLIIQKSDAMDEATAGPSSQSSPNSKPNDSKTQENTPDTEKTVSKFKKQESSDDEDEDIDESLMERLWGLTEMFPESLRSTTSLIVDKTLTLIKGTYQLSRQVVWIGVSSSVLLFAPVMFEVERFNVEEMVKQDRNRLLLGPGSAMSGPPGAPGLAPPPPAR